MYRRIMPACALRLRWSLPSSAKMQGLSRIGSVAGETVVRLRTPGYLLWRTPALAAIWVQWPCSRVATPPCAASRS